MKKFLAVLLAAIMVLSSVATMIVTAGAAPAAASNTPNSILVSDGEDVAEEFYNPDKPGWSLTNNANGDNTYHVVEIQEGKEIEKAAGDKVVGPAEFPVVGYRFHYWAAETLDISGMKYVEFDLYLSDASAYQGKTMIVELASGGIDADEISFEASYPLSDGWNHVRLDIATNFTGKNGNFDKTAWKFLRVFFNSEDKVTVEEGEEFVLAIDNLEFNNGLTNGGAEVAPHRVTLTNCDAAIDGWAWTGDTTLKCDDDPANTGCISKIWQPGDKIPFANVLTYFDLDTIKGAPKGYDTSAATTFKFELYVSDAELMKDIPFEIELTSGGNCDAEEIQWSNQKMGDHIEGGLQTGWNTVVLDVAKRLETNNANPPYRPENWNWFRFFNMQDFAAPDGFTVAVDNVRFEDADGNVVLLVSDCNPDQKGWGGTASALNIVKVTGYDEEEEKDILTMQSVMGTKYTSTVPAAGMVLQYQNPDNTAVNITGMKFIEFDLYVTDASAFPFAKNIVLELTSGGQPDKQELAYRLYTGDNESMGLKDGWNHVVIPLSLFTDKTGGDLQLTYINCFRMYNENALEFEGDEFIVAFDNVKFWDGMKTLKTNARGDVLQARETITFMPNTDAYRYGDWKITDRGDHYRTEGNGVAMYAFPVENSETATGAIISGKFGGQILLSVSTDGEYWEEVYRFEDARAAADEAKHPNNLEKAFRAFDLSEYIVDEEGSLLGDTIYVKFEDAYTGGGWGSMVHYDTPVTLDVIYDIPEFETTDTYVFTINTPAEKPYLVKEGNVNNEGTVRFADGTNEIIYKYDLKRTENLEKMIFSVPLQGQYKVSASKDGTNWADALVWDGSEGGEHGPTQATVKFIDLAKAIDISGVVETVYVKISDAVTTDGYGGAIVNSNSVILSVDYINAAAMKHETTSFKILSADEAPYLHEMKANDLADSRFADENRYWTYKYEISKEVENLKSITWTATINAQYHVQASVDGENWITIGKSEETADKALVNFSASALAAAAEEAGVIYIKIGDAVTVGGNGGRVWVDTPIVLDLAYVPLTDAQKNDIEDTGDAHKVPLNGCNELWSNTTDYVVDFDNATAGSACLSVDMKNGIISQFILPYAVDATSMDTLEFELYLSDLAMLDEIQFADGDSIEICSGGGCDQGEKNYSWKKVFENLKNSGEAKVGWNHVQIKISDMGDTPGSYGDFDRSHIDFMRIFWVGATMPDDSLERFTMKIDNIRLTDAEAMEEIQDQIDRENFEKEHADLVEELRALDDYRVSKNITKDNYETAKAQIEAARANFDKLSEEDQKIADTAGFLGYLEKAEKSLSTYEKAAAEKAEKMAQHQALIDAINALTDQITDANYETMKAAAEAARALYDDLSRSIKKYFEEDGLTAKLDAVEIAIATFTPGGVTPPECTEHVDADNNGKCDNCDADVEKKPDDGEQKPDDGEQKPDDGEQKPGDDEEGGGCGSALTIGAIATMILAGAWVTIAARKKD